MEPTTVLVQPSDQTGTGWAPGSTTPQNDRVLPWSERGCQGGPGTPCGAGPQSLSGEGPLPWGHQLPQRSF